MLYFELGFNMQTLMHICTITAVQNGTTSSQTIGVLSVRLTLTKSLKRQLSSLFYLLDKKWQPSALLGDPAKCKSLILCSSTFPFPIIWEFSMLDSLCFYPRWRFNLKRGMEIKKPAYVYLSINRLFIWEALPLRR